MAPYCSLLNLLFTIGLNTIGYVATRFPSVQCAYTYGENG